MKNPNWTRDELILTLDFYFDDNHGSFDKKNPDPEPNLIPLYEPIIAE